MFATFLVLHIYAWFLKPCTHTLSRRKSYILCCDKVKAFVCAPIYAEDRWGIRKETRQRKRRLRKEEKTDRGIKGVCRKKIIKSGSQFKEDRRVWHAVDWWRDNYIEKKGNCSMDVDAFCMLEWIIYCMCACNIYMLYVYMKMFVCVALHK